MVMAGESKFSKHRARTASCLLRPSWSGWRRRRYWAGVSSIVKRSTKCFVPTNPRPPTPANFTFSRNQITCEEIKQCRFCSPIRPHNSNPGPILIPTSTFDSLKSSLFG
ncbi:LOW QUALITY PROTEIN: hypothetical protein TorRG33x02_348630 [Trema orientale]|uniref:Uncharacterized protein n=1 Tax=Trema orientale TaxID=63057 RepID=A0A2P5AJT9_TREOI|nr:LOW QUALITY PROTEIN: hypothetical protein TorRG33x02_348630 [Trema orientale]